MVEKHPIVFLPHFTTISRTWELGGIERNILSSDLLDAAKLLVTVRNKLHQLGACCVFVRYTEDQWSDFMYSYRRPYFDAWCRLTAKKDDLKEIMFDVERFHSQVNRQVDKDYLERLTRYVKGEHESKLFDKIVDITFAENLPERQFVRGNKNDSESESIHC